MLFTYRSNNFEILIDRLSDLLQQQPMMRSVLAKEVVVVQSNGMARWLTLRLANLLGICTNVVWQLPESFLYEMNRLVLGKLPAVSTFNEPVLIWRIMKLLRNLDVVPCFEPLHTYLDGDTDDFRCYELACHITDCFDKYLMYRPDWIMQWEAGEEEHWQAELWRLLVAAYSEQPHQVRIYKQFTSTLDSLVYGKNRLPERVAIVGVVALPPLYLDLIAKLSLHIDVHWFILDPCQKYWGDVHQERDIASLSEKTDIDATYLNTGNPLLDSLGKQGRDFLDLLKFYPYSEWDCFVTPVNNNLLHWLQADILLLHNRGNGDCPKLPLLPNELSVQIHACHSQVREVEVLHDQLLAMFQSQPDLCPSDVIVMSPEIDVYGPLIRAVFASGPRKDIVPVSFIEPVVDSEGSIVEVFFNVLDLIGGRFDSVQVLALLDVPAIRRRFKLTEKDLRQIHHWVHVVRIRWGINAGLKSNCNLPTTAEHTWQAGLDRLLLGYALCSDGMNMYGDILPYDDIEGNEAQALGHLQAFIDALALLDSRLRQVLLVEQWVAEISVLLDQFFKVIESEECQLQLVRNVLEELRENARLARFSQTVNFSVIKAELRRRLHTVEGRPGFSLSGGIICCGMSPMRSVPFPVICLIGMNNDAYPSRQRPFGIDLMSCWTRHGDPSHRQDDRYLFLEILLSVRRCLYISYIGRNIHDNSVLPPSILVGELLDIVDRGFQCNEGGLASEQLVTYHPLQVFNQSYFRGDSHLFSYAQEWVAASSLSGHCDLSTTIPLFISTLPEPSPAMRSLTLRKLVKFFKNPTAMLIQERLGIRLEQSKKNLETHEPFVLDRLDNYRLISQVLELHLNDYPVFEIKKAMYASGELPHGRVGDFVFAQNYMRVVKFARHLKRVSLGCKPESLSLDLTIGKFRLTGCLPKLPSQQGLLFYRMSDMKAVDYLNLWLHHLVLNIIAPAGSSLKSCWVAADKDIILNPIGNAKSQLAMLLELYWHGLCSPLHFFPKSALAYAQKIINHIDMRKASHSARTIWEGSRYYYNDPAEGDDPYYRLAFRDTYPLDTKFETLAVEVFKPLFICMQTEPHK